MNEIITNARNFLKIRTDSLQKDVRYCILDNDGQANWPAPFPALLYCFSVIDLLGELYSGEDSIVCNECEQAIAKSASGITKRSQNYMIDLMKYPEEKAKLIQKVFRHKIVHLAQLNPSTKINGKKYRWGYEHNNRSIHLSLKETKQPGELVFRVSIWSLVEDIVDSVYKPDGYLHRLERENVLQEKFKKAYKQIFGQEEDRK